VAEERASPEGGVEAEVEGEAAAVENNHSHQNSYAFVSQFSFSRGNAYLPFLILKLGTMGLIQKRISRYITFKRNSQGS
jgi:hypothetical protein